MTDAPAPRKVTAKCAVMFRLEPTLVAKLDDIAHAERVSRTALVERVLRESIETRKAA